MSKKGGRSRLTVVLAGVLSVLLSWAPASADGHGPPDQVDPPAEGESQPLDDPTDPAPLLFSTAAYPSPSVDLSGPSWPRPSVQRYVGRNVYGAAVRASRAGWPHGAATVVLARDDSGPVAMGAAALAGTVGGPLLLTDPGELKPSIRSELRRLDPRRVVIAGAMPTVKRRLEAMGRHTEMLRGRNRYATAMAIARRAVREGANRRTVVVISGRPSKDSLGAAALASGKRHPIVLTRPATGRAALETRVAALGAQRVFVVGRRSVIRDRVIQGLPNVTRLSGTGAMGTVAATARRGRRMGLDARPMLTSGRHWADATIAGAWAGRPGSVVIATTGRRGMSRQTARWLAEDRPERVNTVQGQSRLPALTRCQLNQGRFRNWFCAEQTLRAQGYVVPRADGRTDRFSVWAIFAFRKVAGMRATRRFGNGAWDRMLRNPRVKVRRPDLPARHVEINIGKQLILLVRNGKVRHHIHTSTGKPSTPTIRGTFTVYEKRPYRQANGMYKSIFFYGGYAIHGYPKIPLYPASHGCARTYDGNEDFLYPRIAIGDRVATY